MNYMHKFYTTVFGVFIISSSFSSEGAATVVAKGEVMRGHISHTMVLHNLSTTHTMPEKSILKNKKHLLDKSTIKEPRIMTEKMVKDKPVNKKRKIAVYKK